MELPDRLRKVAVELSQAAGAGGDQPQSAPESEAAAALVALGFSRAESQIAVSRSRREIGGDPPAEALVRRALKQLSGPGRG
jgi:Holliday junction resolvasome RuvABC DNA-binding subunit